MGKTPYPTNRAACDHHSESKTVESNRQLTQSYDGNIP